MRFIYILLAIAFVFTIGCQGKSIELVPIENNVVEYNEDTEKNVEKDRICLLEIPSEDRYMFEGGICEDKNYNGEIRKIALYKKNPLDDNQSVFLKVYGKIDFDAKKATYGVARGALDDPYDYQQYDLSDDEVEIYKNTLKKEYLKHGMDIESGWWKMAIEYEDGSCYSYEFHKEAYAEGSPENLMIRTYFDKINQLSSSERDILSLFAR